MRAMALMIKKHFTKRPLSPIMDGNEVLEFMLVFP
jgi:hypothetical protein